MKKIQATWGESADGFARRLVEMARRDNERIEGTHNGRVMIADPTSTFAEVFEQWDLEGRRSYFGESEKFRTRSN